MVKKEVEPLLKKVQKPARYTGGELNSVIKNKENIKLRYAFCFPDSYEIGMSHLGLKILYSLVNARDDAWCERVFAPWEDMEKLMRENGVKLYGLESGDPICDFDLIGFTMQYELSYTNVLNMLDLGGVPVLKKDRTSLTPIIIAGGPCVCNPEPITDFIDIFLPGEGEEVTNELIDLLIEHKEKGSTRLEFLREAAKIEGVYVPEFYDVEYNGDGTVKEYKNRETAPKTVKKRIISDLNNAHYPEKFVVPFIDVVQDRTIGEVFRGCIRGCRFCQAGFIYRPIREKSADTIDRQCHTISDATGYEEVSLCSLSTSDYSEIDTLIPKLFQWALPEKINVALPSLRVDNFSDELLNELKKIRRSGLTFAPEAGTQRLRDAINKNVTEEDVERTASMAWAGGWSSIKLYFMMGLPTETMEDITGIADLAQKVVDLYYKTPDRQKGKAVSVSVSCASFVPKPFTPFQWEPQDTPESLIEKQKHLLSSVHSRKVSVSYHESKTSVLEGVFARGDRRLGQVIYKAWQKGSKFDSWDEFFNFDNWLEAFNECGLTPEFYANRVRGYDEVFPWDIMDYGIRKEFLIEENKKAHKSETTPHCRIKCSACGANKLNGGKCDARTD
ncbi:MAG: TIGR03960 family B12-binding radical SAM protein [Oscillospiraceae bacterium]|nr:TIGR03960 family B12-binding radical SAM protein [Oscillospiraceae bacterium]